MEYRTEMGASAMFWNDEKTLSERMKVEREKIKKLAVAFGFYGLSMGIMYLFL
ncbi:MAG: hypothetical protein R6U17_00660 [Thermoplasmata archaeon]